MGRAHEVRAASMAKTAALKTKVYSRFGKELYMAAKSGVPDPDMNQTLKRKIAEAKANQVPASVIDRAIEKAKGGTVENYISNRYEGFGPGASTVIIDCLTDNVNRSISEIKTCFNKAKSKLGVQGSVSFNYNELGIFSFEYDDDEKMLDTLINSEIDVVDLELEDGIMTVYVTVPDFHKTQGAIEELIPDINFDVCEITMLPNEYVKLENETDIELFNRLLNLLNEVEDVQNVYHNVEM
ncbi:MAG: YebC/PmpR family DNA-binding transcriptional regulator [Erysipelotrichaceae bacterium]|nr:YebC/PmpR family DNA-binding transcriptional regulator [Erysipelotrichaceae bacterium]